MCGRFAPAEFLELSEILRRLPFEALSEFGQSWNAAPSQILPVLVESPDEDHLQLKGMTWGLVPAWTKPGERPKVTPINARAETLAEKPMFRSLLKNKRCVIPAQGFFEWQRVGLGKNAAKQPFYIHMKDGTLMFFAGLYDEARNVDGAPLESFTIITTAANDDIATLHDRMPVMLPLDELEHWLSHSEKDPESLDYLLKPAPDDVVEMYPVSKAVNNPRNDTPDLIEPLDEQSSLFEDDEG